MAARTQGSGTAYAVSLVLFVILFLFSFIAAIIFGTRVSGAQLQAQEAATALGHFVKPDERKLPRVLELKDRQASTGHSIVGQLLSENKTLKRFINNSPNSPVEAISKELTSSGLRDRTLLGEIRRLNAEHAAANDLVEQYKDQLDAGAVQFKAIEDQKTAQAEEHEKTIVSLKSTLSSLQDDFNTFRQQVDAQRQALEKQLDTARMQTQRHVNELRSTIEQKDHQIGAQRKRLDELTGELASTGKGGGQDLTRESDGLVTSILSEEGLVYIDRGRADQILLGMTFEVFDKDGGVVVDETGELRGKATIEAIRMSDRSSLCRVVRLERNKTVNESDLIANVIYDPNISYRFYVFGEFDIDNTGQVTTTDRRRVETMVTQWGGQLINKLSYNTDFLVLGQEPEPPQPLPRNVVDPLVIERHAAKKHKFEKYQALIEEAKALSIPILNQNRFLALVGYYHR